MGARTGGVGVSLAAASAVQRGLLAQRQAWIRYTVFSPKGRPEQAVGELLGQEACQPERSLVSRQRAAFEVFTERSDHGVAVVA